MCYLGKVSTHDLLWIPPGAASGYRRTPTLFVSLSLILFVSRLLNYGTNLTLRLVIGMEIMSRRLQWRHAPAALNDTVAAPPEKTQNEGRGEGWT